MALHDDEIARRESGTVECRGEAVRLQWACDELPAADAHVLDCRFGCSMRIADNATDRRMFVEVFLNNADSATRAAIAAHFSHAIRAEMAKLAAATTAADAVAGDQKDEWIAALTRAAKPVAFASGLELLPPYDLQIQSPSLRRQRLDEVARARVQERSAGQLEQMQHAGEVLKQFQALRQTAPDLPPGALLQQLNPADRGLTLQTLLMASAAGAPPAPLFAVAGHCLVQVDPRDSSPRPAARELPASLGPLRSVQTAEMNGRPVLLIGARGGIMVVPREGADEPLLFPMPDLDSQLGFNAVVLRGRFIWASHSDAGLVRWRVDYPDAPPAVHAQKQARNLRSIDESRVLYSAGNQLFLGSADAAEPLNTPSGAEIVAILPAGRMMVVVQEDGTLTLLNASDLSLIDTRRRGITLQTAGLMPWLGDFRLLLATDAGPIDCLGLDDPLVTQYLSPYRGMKMVEACVDLIAAVAPDRQRVVIWRPWDTQRPVGDIHITSLVRHRIADITFG